MIRVLAVAIAAAFIAAPDTAGAQGKSENDAMTAARFGISIDGAQKAKSKGLKASSGKKKSGMKNY